MRLPTSLILAATLAGALAVATFADARERDRGGPPGIGGQSVFLSGAALEIVAFDADGDYLTTRKEFDAGLARETDKAFAAAATLSPIAFEAWAAKALGGPALGPFRFAFDANMDGQISRAEFAAAFADEFKRYDKNGDGAISRTELAEHLPDMRGLRGPDGETGPPGGPGGRPPGGRGGRPPSGGPG